VVQRRGSADLLGRGAYCGWLCPFGALQELTNQIARKLRIPQWTLPWGLHERLWPIKYMIFLGLFGVSLMSIEQAEHLAEVEPFKTAIVLKFVRAWPFVAYALALLAAGLFVERFYCRYLCPLGAALAIPARMRMFDWLKRYKRMRQPLPDLRHRMPGAGDPPDGRDQPERMHRLPALPGPVPVQDQMPGRDQEAEAARDRFGQPGPESLGPSEPTQTPTS
jgi:NosR/NirI family nitrous oxide reductase transcriptional regulator